MKWQRARLILEKVHPRMMYRYEGDFWVGDEIPPESHIPHILKDGKFVPMELPESYVPVATRPTNLRGRGIAIHYQADTVQLLDEFTDNPPLIELERKQPYDRKTTS